MFVELSRRRQKNETKVRDRTRRSRGVSEEIHTEAISLRNGHILSTGLIWKD